MDGLGQVGSCMDFDWDTATMKVDSPNGMKASSEGFHEIMDPDVNSVLWSSIQQLLNRPWFRRLWVWQEVFLSRLETLVVCGEGELDYTHLCKAVLYYFARKPGVNWLGRLHGMTLFSMRKAAVPVYECIYVTKSCECSDQRDRVYGILAMCSENYDVVPNYSKSVQEVFQAVVMHQYEEISSLKLLSLCSDKDPSGWLQSWVNWSTSNSIRRLEYGFADARYKAQAYYAGNGVLKAMGVSISAVAHTAFENDLPSGELMIDRDRNASKANHIVAELLRYIVGPEITYLSNSKIESLCRALCCGEFSDNHIPRRATFANFRKSCEYLTSCWRWSTGHSSTTPDIHTRFLEGASRMMRDRTLALTANGLLGLVPRGTRAGDQVCIILGCSKPLILRPVGTSHDSSTIVGECYVDGIMTGEALLGELPEKWRFVFQWHPREHIYFPKVFDRESRRTQDEDPRLDPLQGGWRSLKPDEDHSLTRYVNDDTGEDAGDDDPRLNIDTSKARGVQFKEFSLV